MNDGVGVAWSPWPYSELHRASRVTLSEAKGYPEAADELVAVDGDPAPIFVVSSTVSAGRARVGLSGPHIDNLLSMLGAGLLTPPAAGPKDSRLRAAPRGATSSGRSPGKSVDSFR